VSGLDPDALIRREPLGSEELFAEVDPTAAAVAGAHWLQAAADVAESVSGIDATRIVATADDIQALQVLTPSRVIERLGEGSTPRAVVTELVADALTTAEGKIPDLDGLLDQVAEANETSLRYGERADEMREALLPERITLLDPQRPAQDLLEDLLSGILGCWLIYEENTDSDDLEEIDEDDQEAWDRGRDELRREFEDRVREEAEAAKGRLM
jgi:hypothetical protein